MGQCEQAGPSIRDRTHLGRRQTTFGFDIRAQEGHAVSGHMLKADRSAGSADPIMTSARRVREHDQAAFARARQHLERDVQPDVRDSAFRDHQSILGPSGGAAPRRREAKQSNVVHVVGGAIQEFFPREVTSSRTVRYDARVGALRIRDPAGHEPERRPSRGDRAGHEHSLYRDLFVLEPPGDEDTFGAVRNNRLRPLAPRGHAHRGAIRGPFRAGGSRGRGEEVDADDEPDRSHGVPSRSMVRSGPWPHASGCFGSLILARPIHEPAARERGLHTIRCVVRPAASSTCPPTRLRRGRPNSLRPVHIPHSRLAVHE